MDFLKKAKAKQKELSAQLDGLTKSAQALNFGDKKKESGSASTTTATPSSATPVDPSGSWKEVSVDTPSSATPSATPLTPATTVAPPEKARAKLSLVQRKSVRDEWESNKAGFEQRLTKALGVPWTIDVDAAAIMNVKGDGAAAAIDSAGSMLNQYVEQSVEHIEGFAKQYATTGVHELNQLAPNHVLELDLDNKKQKDFTSRERYQGFEYSRPDYAHGNLLLLINRDALWSNVGKAMSSITFVTYFARERDPELKPTVDFECVTSIESEWEPEATKLLEKARKLLANPNLTFDPHWQETWQKLDQYYRADEDQKLLDWGWRNGFAAGMYNYFESFVRKLEDNKFKDDDLLQEGFNELVSKNIVAFRFVDKLKRTTGQNEVAIEDGILWLTTETEKWRSNEGLMGHDLMDHL